MGVHETPTRGNDLRVVPDAPVGIPAYWVQPDKEQESVEPQRNLRGCGRGGQGTVRSLSARVFTCQGEFSSLVREERSEVT